MACSRKCVTDGQMRPETIVTIQLLEAEATNNTLWQEFHMILIGILVSTLNTLYMEMLLDFGHCHHSLREVKKYCALRLYLV